MKRAFTLIELIIVIVIIAILAVVAIPRYFANIEKARQAEAYATMRAIRDAQMAYFARYAAYSENTSFSVDVDQDGTVDISIAANSPNFEFTISSNAVVATTSKGGDSYYMCLESGKVNNTATPTCP